MVLKMESEKVANPLLELAAGRGEGAVLDAFIFSSAHWYTDLSFVR